MEDKLEKAIKDLLVTADVVVLPEFGAFVATDIPAMVDSQNNIIYPPRRKVNFDEKLKSDDGLLIKHYANQERISRDTATVHVSQFVEEVSHRLQRGNPWTIEDLGKFIVDGMHNLNFFPDPDHNFVPQSYGLPDIDLKSVGQVQAMPVEHESSSAKPQKKKEKIKKEKGPRKKSRALLILLISFLLTGAAAFAFFTKVDVGKQLLVTIREKVDHLMGKTEEPAKKEAVKEAAKPETAAGDYQPREENAQFDTPERLDIEPTKMDQFVTEGKSETKEPEKVEEKPVTKVPEPTKEPAKAEKPAPAKKEPAKVEKPAPTETKKVEAKKPEVKKPVEEPKIEKPAPAPNISEQLEAKKTVKEEKLPLPKLVGKATRSSESIYAKYQIVAGEYRSLEEALRYEDGFTSSGYNAAVIQFKDGKFGICVARSNDRTKAEKMLSDIKRQLPETSVKLKEY